MMVLEFLKTRDAYFSTFSHVPGMEDRRKGRLAFDAPEDIALRPHVGSEPDVVQFGVLCKVQAARKEASYARIWPNVMAAQRKQQNRFPTAVDNCKGHQ
eukprot:3104984-Amphidinium_carterae.1